MSENNRRHPRLKHFADIKVSQLSGESITARLRDFSETGLYIHYKQDIPYQVGEQLKVQTLEFEGAPIQTVQVIRIEHGVGFAVIFLTT